MQFDIVANDKASATMGNIDKSMANFGKGMASSISMIAARATLLIAAFQKVSQVINEMGDVADQAARLGVTVEQYQKLKFAAEDYGSSVEEIAKAQKDINKMLDAAATKQQGPEMQTLQALGFSDQDIINRNIKQAEVFERISEAIKGAASEEEKFAVASRVFGDKIATSLVPVLENYGEFKDTMASTVTMSQKSADNLDKLGTSLNGFWQAIKAGTGEVAGKLAGVINTPEGPKLAETEESKAAANAKGEKLRNALLNVGKKKGEEGAGAGGISSMMAIGGASFRGFPMMSAKPIEEQQLAQLQTIAVNTTPQTQSAPPPGTTDMTKAGVNPIGQVADKIYKLGANRPSNAERFKNLTKGVAR